MQGKIYLQQVIVWILVFCSCHNAIRVMAYNFTGFFLLTLDMTIHDRIFICTRRGNKREHNLYFVFWPRLSSQNVNWGAPYFKDLLAAAAVVRRELIPLKLHAWQTIAVKLRTLREMRWMKSSVGCQSSATFLSISVSLDQRAYDY